VSRRQQIEMTDAEVREFLDQQRVMTCATNGARGWPHLMPLWFVVRGDEIWAWTYARSQKTRNLERDPRATLQFESGEDYSELRGVMLECDVVVHRDVEAVANLGMEIFARYTGGTGEEMRALVGAQAPKRVGLQFIERRRATWDHQKLGGVY
jgi:PPOX class probable F420-dependent enzyme